MKIAFLHSLGPVRTVAEEPSIESFLDASVRFQTGTPAESIVLRRDQKSEIPERESLERVIPFRIYVALGVGVIIVVGWVVYSGQRLLGFSAD